MASHGQGSDVIMASEEGHHGEGDEVQPPLVPLTPVKRRHSESLFHSPNYASPFPDSGSRGGSSRQGTYYGSVKRRKAESNRSITPKKLGFTFTQSGPAATLKESPGGSAGGDRFIPCRSGMDMELGHYYIAQGNNENKDRTCRPANTTTPLRSSEFARTLKDTLLNTPGSASSQRSGFTGYLDQGSAIREPPVLSFHDKPPTPHESIYQSPLKVFQFDKLGYGRSPKITRHIPAAPAKILDAPELIDDYYLNLLSWSKQNILAVALGRAVYLWNADNGAIEHLVTLDGSEDCVTSISWAEMEGNQNMIAVGTNLAQVQLWDASSLRQVRTMPGHSARVGSLAWNDNIVSSGGRDALIINHDIRVPRRRVRTLQGHQQEICGLRWSPDGTTLASGGNENYLCLWDSAMDSVGPRLTLTEHQAAVKALAWCPFQRRLLASGGGTADRTIKFWHTGSGTLLNSVDTGSQVCALLWSKHHKELVSSHGFSENQLCLWKYPTMAKIKEFKGHKARVLHLEQSPDGFTVVSAAADETLRFWEIMGTPANDKKKPGGGLLPMLGENGGGSRAAAVYTAIR